MINDKLIAALLAILIALGGWTLSRTFSLSQDMVLVKEKITRIEKDMEEAVWNSLQPPEDKKKHKKKKRKKKKKQD
jgi:regulator of protease activity HflC (stomatin/prohibitin superfamily)|tara:strand:+ start:97 stop:324 length:228 start_codon:yes stop_codon:yes gene_type:complete